jgi:tetratricopeptide (TPR) repeat protein
MRFAKGDYDRAIAWYSEAIKLDPRFALAYSNRGSAYYFKGEFDRAIADYNEVIRLDPSDGLVHAWRGLSYEAKGDSARANEDYERARAQGFKISVPPNSRDRHP